MDSREGHLGCLASLRQRLLFSYVDLLVPPDACHGDDLIDS